MIPTSTTAQLKTALVTGATSGIGLALASRLAIEGWRILVVGRNRGKLESLKHDFGPQAKLLVADLSDTTQTTQLAQTVMGLTDRLDLLANIAGIGIYKSLEEIEDEQWQSSISVNLSTPFLLIKHLIELLRKTPKSIVINQGSGMGVIPTPGRTAYCASKFGLRGMSLCLAEEFKGIDPDIVLITLGSTLTGFGPLSLREKQMEQLRGKTYFTVEWVINKYLEIITSTNRKSEYVFYPSDYDESRLH